MSLPKTIALTVRQPWASAIMLGLKRVENRTWSTSYRGPLAIHAAAKIDPDGEGILREAGIELPQPVEELPRGVVLGLVDLVDVVQRPAGGTSQQSLWGDSSGLDPHVLAHDPLATGPWCWILANPLAYLEPVPASGRLGLWQWAPE